MKKCYLIGAGAMYDGFSPDEDDFIIAVDGGYQRLVSMGFNADMVAGDFDSYSGVPVHDNVVQLQKEKDETDMYFAVQKALKLGYGLIYIYGGTGGRLDHTMANLQSLAFIADAGKRGFLVDDDCIITAVKEGKVSFARKNAGRVSVFAAGDSAEGVCVEGMKYPLHNATLTNLFPIGISNEFTGGAAEVSVAKGTVYIFYPKDAEILI